MKFKVMLFALAMSALMCVPSFAGILDRGCTVCGEAVADCGTCEACDACDSCDTRSCDLFGGLKSLFPGRRGDAGCDPCGEVAVEVCDEVAVDPCEAVADCGTCGACDGCRDSRRPLITLPKIELPKLRRPLCGDCGECGACDEIIADECGACGDGCDTGRRVRLPRLGLVDMLDDLLCGSDCGTCGDCGVCDDVPVCGGCGSPMGVEVATEAVPQILPVSP